MNCFFCRQELNSNGEFGWIICDRHPMRVLQKENEICFFIIYNEQSLSIFINPKSNKFNIFNEYTFKNILNLNFIPHISPENIHQELPRLLIFS